MSKASTTQVGTAVSTAEAMQRYAAAWADRDVDRIIALHAEDCAFQLHDGSPRAKGLEAVRAAFEAVFHEFPDLRAEELRTVVSGDLVAYEYLAVATPRGTTVTVTIEVVDVLELRDGLVARKDTYLDTATLAAQRAS